jgi:ribonucleoside-diphosphate reductase alpha chain
VVIDVSTGSLVRRRLTSPGDDPYAAVEWAPLTVSLRAADGRVVFAREQVLAPVGWSELAVLTVARRYFGRRADGSPERSVGDLIARVVRTLAGWARTAGHAPGAGELAALEAELAVLVLTQRATFATPVWLNVGLEERPFTSACFILETDDSIRALLDWNAREGLIFQQGGGAGINLSKVRSSREPVSRGGLASGPVSFMRAADAWAATIRSGGRARRGAKMVVLDAEHPDVLEFIACKAREEERGAALVAAGYEPREAVRSLAFQHATHAVRVSDAFMTAVRRDDEWELRAVTTGKVLDRLPARELLRTCAQAAWRCGDPGLQFSSTIDRWHTCPNSGPITASNPCGEFLHVGESACNLATLNLLAFLSNQRFDVDGFVHAVELLALTQDAIVDGSAYPTERIRQGAQRFRQIGIGYANLAGVLLTLGIPYDSEQARCWAAAVTALLTGAAYRRSAELARALGPFAEFERNRQPMLSILDRHRDAAGRIGPTAPAEVLLAAHQVWEQAIEAAAAHGLRNAQTTLLPPTGTVSLMLDCESTGIEPYYALAGHRRFADGGQARFESRALGDGLLALGYSTHSLELLCSYAADHGHLLGAPALRPRDRAVVQTATGPDPVSVSGHLAMVAAVQPLLSGGVSKTLNLPADTTAEAIEQIFLDAWRLGLKSIAVYRQGSKIGQPLLAEDDEHIEE